jgi:hypothetical protein
MQYSPAFPCQVLPARAGRKSGATIRPPYLMNTNRINVSATALSNPSLSLAVDFNERDRFSAVCFVQDVTRVVIHANVVTRMVGNVWHGPVSLPRKPISDE